MIFYSPNSRASVVTILVVLAFVSPARANLIANGSFEAPIGFSHDLQGLMPPGWTATNESPDLYGSNGLFGLEPSFAGNFTDVVAADGAGFVAGWTAFIESFGQRLPTPLTPGEAYRATTQLMQARRANLDFPGAYDILLNSTNDLSGAVQVASFDFTTDSEEWEFRSAVFTAPQNAISLPWVIFRPSGNSSYPGMDDLTLVSIPEPSSTAILLIAVLLLSMQRKCVICMSEENSNSMKATSSRLLLR